MLNYTDSLPVQTNKCLTQILQFSTRFLLQRAAVIYQAVNSIQIASFVIRIQRTQEEIKARFNSLRKNKRETCCLRHATCLALKTNMPKMKNAKTYSIFPTKINLLTVTNYAKAVVLQLWLTAIAGLMKYIGLQCSLTMSFDEDRWWGRLPADLLKFH